MFTVAGVSLRDGKYKVRYANDMTRIKVLVKTGHTDINLMELPEPMDKAQIAAFLKTTELYLNDAYREAIDAADSKYNEDNQPEAPAVEAVKPVKVKAQRVKIKAEPAAEIVSKESQPQEAV